jgi:hypothetical protein
VETRGPQDDEAGTETLRESNVIRLPRDWLGPREELVPLGIGGDAASFGIGPDRESTHPDSTDGPGVDQLEAADFWGEGSAAVQRALEAPAERAQSELRRLRAPRMSIRAAMVGACAASLLAIGTIELGLPGSSRPSDAGGFAFKSSGLAVVLPPLLAGDGDRAPRHGPIARVRAHSAVRHASRTRPKRSAPPPPARSTPVSTNSVSSQSEPSASTPGTAPGSLSAGSGTDSSSPVPSSAVEQVSGSHESASTGKANGGSSSGPVGAGAPFGPGHLG